MTRNVRGLACALMVAVGLMALSGCGGSSSADRSRPLIGVTLLTRTHDFYKDLEETMRAEAAERGFDLAIVSCEMDPARQVSQFEDFITQRVDAILAAPCDSKAVVPSIDAAERAGIPVFTIDIAAHGGNVVSHIASDNAEGGRLAARTLATLIGGSGDIVIIDHPDVASGQDRVRGFEEEMAKHPGVRIVQRPSAGGQRARAMAVMEDMLQVHRSLKGVFGINDDSALGALSVLEAANRTDIVIVGFDATAEAREAVRRGSALRADIAQHPHEIARTAVDAIDRHFAGEPVDAVTAVRVDVVDTETLAAADASR